MEAPHLRVVRVGTTCIAYVEGFYGRAWEYDEGSGSLKFTSGTAEAAGRRGAELDPSFLQAKPKGHKVLFEGAEECASGPAYRIRVLLADGWEKQYFLDVRSLLAVALIKSMPIHAQGDPVTSRTTFEDHHPVDSIVTHFREIERRVDDNAEMNRLQWERIEHNLPLATEHFEPPVT